MLGNPCPELLATSDPSFFIPVAEDSNIIKDEQNQGTWILPTLGTSFMREELTKSYLNLIKAEEYGKAADFMLNEVYEHSKILADSITVNFEDATSFSSFIETIYEREIITEVELNRLTVLQMVLDGIDMEVHECGRKISERELKYLSEFLLTLKKILARNNTYVGLSTGNAVQVIFSQELILESKNQIYIMLNKEVVSPSSFCIIGYMLGQTNVVSSESFTGFPELQ